VVYIIIQIPHLVLWLFSAILKYIVLGHVSLRIDALTVTTIYLLVHIIEQSLMFPVYLPHQINHRI